MRNIVNTWYWTCDFCKGHTDNPIIMNSVIEDVGGLVRNLICCPNCLPKEGESLMIEVERDSEYNPEEFEDNGFDPKAYIGKIKNAYKDVADHLIPKEIVDGLSDGNMFKKGGKWKTQGNYNYLSQKES